MFRTLAVRSIRRSPYSLSLRSGFSTTFRSFKQPATQSTSPLGQGISPASILGQSTRKDVYQLPTNDAEISRLNNQHVMLKMLIGGNYIGPVKQHLQRATPETKRILDIGCGTGAWAMDMATEFPECSVVAVDVAPMQTELSPPNLTMEVLDVNKGLKGAETSFDLINARMIAMGITDYSSLINEISKSLRPQGILHLQEWDFHVVDINKQRILSMNSWFVRWCAALRNALDSRNASIEAGSELDEMVRSHGAFGKVHQVDTWMPVGGFFPTDTIEGRHMNLIGEFMREDVKAFIKGGRALILGSGMSTSEYIELEHNALKEVHEVTTPSYLRLNCVWAHKL